MQKYNDDHLLNMPTRYAKKLCKRIKALFKVMYNQNTEYQLSVTYSDFKNIKLYIYGIWAASTA